MGRQMGRLNSFLALSGDMHAVVYLLQMVEFWPDGYVDVRANSRYQI